MKTYNVTVDKLGKYEIEIVAIKCGNDYNVAVCGGSRHHVGAVALGCNRPDDPVKGPRSANVSVICVFEHKDDEVARIFAKEMSTRLKCKVSVSAGVHVDIASLEDIEALMKNCKLACDEIIKAIQQDNE